MIMVFLGHRPSLHVVSCYFGDKELLGAELGAQIGLNAERMFKYMKISRLFLVDNWKDCNGTNEYQLSLTERLLSYKERYELIVSDSHRASEVVLDNILDFIYIDGDHSFAGCYGDLHHWWPKVWKEGILCGHDFGSEVAEAVVLFCKERGLQFWFTNLDLDWIILKTQRDIPQEWLTEGCRWTKVG